MLYKLLALNLFNLSQTFGKVENGILNMEISQANKYTNYTCAGIGEIGGGRKADADNILI